MVLILDHTRSDRASKLRRRILDMKIPCAVSAVWSCADLLPPFCIITFADVLDKVYHAPLEKYKIFVLTEALVNSALHVIACAAENELLHHVVNTVYECAGIKEEHILDGALVLHDGFLLTQECLFHRCFPLKLSDTECSILLLLLLTGGCHPAKHLTAYCFPDAYKGDTSTSVSSAVYRINKNAESQSGAKLISYSRKHGGYILDVRYTKEI